VGAADCCVAKSRYLNILAQSDEMARSKNKSIPRSELRIIGGQWRSRKLSFTPAQGLRPTTDRIRETLFNWLSPVIRDARCADLFAGSGALGLEALSRGADHCDFIDTSAPALNQVSQHLATLGAQQSGSCHAGSAEQFLQGAHPPLDIIFIDPPFGLGLVASVCQSLSLSQLLAEDAWVYIETPKNEALPELPDNWQLHRDKIAGDVAYRLFHINPIHS